MNLVLRLGLLGVLVAAGLALSRLLDPPALWVLGAAITLAACVGADQVIHLHWRQRRQRRRYDITLWIFPALIVAGGFLVLRLSFFAGTAATALGVVAATAIFLAVVFGQLHSLSTEDPRFRVARFALNLFAYISAFGIYSAIYAPRVRSLYSAPAVMLVTFLICLELFRGQRVSGRRAALYAGVLGLAVGEVTWALNYWLVSALAGGLLMLVVLYVGSGVLQSHLTGQLTRQTVLEFLGVAAAAVVLALGSGLLGG